MKTQQVNLWGGICRPEITLLELKCAAIMAELEPGAFVVRNHCEARFAIAPKFRGQQAADEAADAGQA